MNGIPHAGVKQQRKTQKVHNGQLRSLPGAGFLRARHPGEKINVSAMTTGHSHPTDSLTMKPEKSTAIDIEDSCSSKTSASIGEGELKRTHTFWSCKLSSTNAFVIKL